MCDVLKEVYRGILDEQFDYRILNQRIKLQKIVYLLENMGVKVGDYSFTWNKYGPYSIALDDDAYRCSQVMEHNDVNFTKEAKDAFQKIKGIVSEADLYELHNWLECISSLHYLKYVLHVSDEEIIKELVRRKPYLNELGENRRAMQIANKIEIGM